MKDDELYINELNKDREVNVELSQTIEKLINHKQHIKILEKEILELEDKLVKSNFRVIGVKDLNVRVAITPSKNEKILNYEKSLIESGLEVEKYQIHEKKETIVTTLDKELVDKEIEIGLLTKMVYDDKARKATISIKDLVKPKKE